MPEKPEIWGKRVGDVCMVFVDMGTNIPQSINNFEAEPVGLFKWTGTPEQVLAHFPGYIFKFHEDPNPVSPKTTIVSDLKTTKMVEEASDRIHKSLKLPKKAETSILSVDNAVPEVVVATDTAGNAPTVREVDQQYNLVDRASIENYRKKLEMALEYAGAKNKRILKIKLETINELLEEIKNA